MCGSCTEVWFGGPRRLWDRTLVFAPSEDDLGQSYRSCFKLEQVQIYPAPATSPYRSTQLLLPVQIYPTARVEKIAIRGTKLCVSLSLALSLWTDEQRKRRADAGRVRPPQPPPPLRHHPRRRYNSTLLLSASPYKSTLFAPLRPVVCLRDLSVVLVLGGLSA
eukprot:3532450-Rhodomonas_salina.1